jgi:hypothetical protein
VEGKEKKRIKWQNTLMAVGYGNTICMYVNEPHLKYQLKRVTNQAGGMFS